jgi:hypothetical protein
MARLLAFISIIAAVAVQVASADEVRHTTFAIAVQGTWAPSAELCQAQDKSSVVISETKYTDGDGTCSVDSVVERAGVPGPFYAARALCADAAQPSKDRAVNFIIRPESNDKISIGKSFDDLKIYQRCPAR